ncbi:hypothetical protein [Sphingomonas pseudosanguinis]|uniref:Uncharacterized protein n=1 Tax=Sphingomonas pseudosanguinis TaxID=413712 RepID=A0A7W6F1L2_9SPHN|nr:hypothetical protein [Sphingomonas pseudosanguinis]MBB3877903.1 hypothetical protein [Sphingomonas pseudosanguinis]MBN3537776.1 hypothetical protein [Sphingomonas pseudosanguinis]
MMDNDTALTESQLIALIPGERDPERKAALIAKLEALLDPPQKPTP